MMTYFICWFCAKMVYSLIGYTNRNCVHMRVSFVSLFLANVVIKKLNEGVQFAKSATTWTYSSKKKIMSNPSFMACAYVYDIQCMYTIRTCGLINFAFCITSSVHIAISELITRAHHSNIVRDPCTYSYMIN